jgi:hypothetical protein
MSKRERRLCDGDFDNQIRARNALGETWPIVARAIGRSTSAVMARGHFLGLSSAPRRLVWTEEQNARIREGCARGETLKTIAAELGVSYPALRMHARTLEIRRRAPRPKARPIEQSQRACCGADPLPSGHPLSWEMLIAGTCLAGTRYPLPVLR